MVTKEYLIEILKENKVFEEGEFTLASGKKSNYYVNMKRAITEPEILSTIAQLINEKIGDDIDKIAGPALGAVPIATASSILSDIPLLMIRKEKKSYGTSKQIEGELNGYFYLPLSNDVGKSESEGKGTGEYVRVKGESVEIIADELTKDGEKAYFGYGHNKAIAQFYNSLANNHKNFINFTSCVNTLNLLFDIYKK